MAKRTRKPVAVFEHGTRIYAPVDGERRHRIVARDPATGDRIFVAAGTEQEAGSAPARSKSASKQRRRSGNPTGGHGPSRTSPAATWMIT